MRAVLAWSARGAEVCRGVMQGRTTLPQASRIAESRARQRARFRYPGYGSSPAFAGEAPSSSSASFTGTA
jgi:hypothetical protein